MTKWKTVSNKVKSDIVFQSYKKNLNEIKMKFDMLMIMMERGKK